VQPEGGSSGDGILPESCILFLNAGGCIGNGRRESHGIWLDRMIKMDNFLPALPGGQKTDHHNVVTDQPEIFRLYPASDFRLTC